MKLKEAGGKFWRKVRWYLVGGALIFGLVTLLLGLAQLAGYMGTTTLRATETNSTVWRDFTSLISQEGTKGAPYSWVSDPPAETSTTVKFDSRLVEALTYLSETNDTTCGWSGQHESIGLWTDQATASSDLSYPSQNLPSTSTLYRGVGVRITGADRVKCTIHPRTDRCPDQVARTFDQKNISFASSNLMKPDKLYDVVNCQVSCAVDYYPSNPTNASLDEVTPPADADFIAQKDLNPGVFDYVTIAESGQRAAIYKTAQIAYELMQTDEAGCYDAAAGEGSKRHIPLTIIFPQWMVKDLGGSWADFLTLAGEKFPNSLQASSPLAGLSSDPNLNGQGLHFNY